SPNVHFSTFFFRYASDPLVLPSFPTRRSSDLLVDCANNIMIWLGSGPFPEPLPATFNGKPCFTLMTGQAGVDYWNTVVTRWKARSEEHTSELQSLAYLVCRLLLEKKK